MGERETTLDEALACDCASHLNQVCDKCQLIRPKVESLRAALTQSAEKVARLERTVERMREALRETNVAPREHGGDICCLCESTSEFAERLRHKPDCLLAASSPDHAGAPEGETT